MLKIEKINNPEDFKKYNLNRDQFVDFLFEHLIPFGDEKSAISKSLDYVFSNESGKGGFLLAAFKDDKLAGELVMNSTGMDEYIPENILVYIAVDSEFRNMGIGRKIIEIASKHCEGNIALHVEYNNPAKRLYERLGFMSKYAEMRLIK